jgi:hypothetical protein
MLDRYALLSSLLLAVIWCLAMVRSGRLAVIGQVADARDDSDGR